MEFALVIPIMALLLLVAIDFGRMLFLYIDVHNAAREGAYYGSINPKFVQSANSADPDNTYFRARQELGSGTDASVTISVSCSAGNCQTAPSGTSIQVNVSKPFTFLTPMITNIVGSNLVVGASATAVIQ